MTFAELPAETERLAAAIVDAAYRVHSALGSGLLESAYETCLEIEFQKRGIEHARQIALPVVYEGVVIEPAYRLDFLVGRQIVVEVKAVGQLMPQHTAQVLTYIKLSELRLGLLINFHAVPFRTGIKRVIR